MKPIDSKHAGELYGWLVWLALLAVGLAMLPA